MWPRLASIWQNFRCGPLYLDFFPGVLMLGPYLYLTFTYTNYYYLPAYPKIWKHIHRDEGRVNRINRGLKRSKRRTNQWLCPVHSAPTVPIVLTYSIVRSLCVWRSEDNLHEFVLSSYCMVPGIELWLPGPGQVPLPVRPFCYPPTCVRKAHTLAGCGAEHVGGRHRLPWLLRPGWSTEQVPN